MFYLTVMGVFPSSPKNLKCKIQGLPVLLLGYFITGFARPKFSQKRYKRTQISDFAYTGKIT